MGKKNIENYVIVAGVVLPCLQEMRDVDTGRRQRVTVQSSRDREEQWTVGQGRLFFRGTCLFCSVSLGPSGSAGEGDAVGILVLSWYESWPLGIWAVHRRGSCHLWWALVLLDLGYLREGGTVQKHGTSQHRALPPSCLAPKTFGAFKLYDRHARACRKWRFGMLSVSCWVSQLPSGKARGSQYHLGQVQQAPSKPAKLLAESLQVSYLLLGV